MPDGNRASRRSGSHRPSRAAAQRVAVYGRGRVCAEPSCATVLSAYNPSAYCCLHEKPARGTTVSRQRATEQLVRKICAHDPCQRPFASANPSRRYCSDRCRMAAFQRRRALEKAAAPGLSRAVSDPV